MALLAAMAKSPDGTAIMSAFFKKRIYEFKEVTDILKLFAAISIVFDKKKEKKTYVVQPGKGFLLCGVE